MGTVLNWTRRNKYNRADKSRRTADGITFDSIAEMNRYLELKLLQKRGLIKGLKLQPKFLLIPKSEKVKRATYYYADFQYSKNGKIIIEDVKGFKTEVYKLKKKLLLSIYPEINFFENTV